MAAPPHRPLYWCRTCGLSAHWHHGRREAVCTHCGTGEAVVRAVLPAATHLHLKEMRTMPTVARVRAVRDGEGGDDDIALRFVPA